MRYRDILKEDEVNMNYDVTDDRAHIMNLDDTRKPRLTLRHINKLRQMREAKKLDMSNRQETWGKMYGVTGSAGAPEEEMDMGF